MEFLDFICRVSIDFWVILQRPDASIDKMVYELLYKLFDRAARQPERFRHLQEKAKKGVERVPFEFPELVPIMDNNSDNENE